jgi:hypothetical protein
MTHRKRGFSLLSVSLSIGLILVFGLILASYVMSSRQAGKALENAVSGMQIAEAGVRKAIFCLNALSGAKCGGYYGANYPGETDVEIGGGKFTTTVTGSGADRTIEAVATTASKEVYKVTAEVTTVPPTDETAFSYALQSGDGGAHLENNAEVSGTLYADGDVDCQTTQGVVDGDIWVAKAGGIIDSCTVNYNAHADKVFDSEVKGDAYYKNDPADIAGTDVDGTKYPNSTTPAYADLPTVNLEFWHDSAEAGGTTYGDYYPSDNSSLGPIKIVGNLILNNNIDVTLNGPVWVVGDITLNNNSSLTLASAFGANSTVILADDPANLATKGFINVINGAKIYGSGDPKSHIMLATTNTSTSDTVPALSVANNASGAVFYALSGTMRLQANGGAKSLAAKRLFIDQNAIVTYVESELSDLNFSNSPGGTWHLKAGSWRESR